MDVNDSIEGTGQLTLLKKALKLSKPTAVSIGLFENSRLCRLGPRFAHRNHFADFKILSVKTRCGFSDGSVAAASGHQPKALRDSFIKSAK